MKTRTLHIAAVLAIMMALNSPAWAHNPLEDDGTHITYQEAIPVPDASVSRVVYHEVTADSPRVWLVFEATAGQPFNVQVGVPVIERLREYRPAYAILGPGLDPVDVPFAIPEGYGGWVFNTEGENPFDTFYEPFTGTESWRFEEQEFDLPAAGTYYAVAYVPSGELGKLWMAVGKAEVFTLSDILKLPRIIVDVRAFHETGPIGGIAMWALIALGSILAAVLGMVAL